MRGRIDVVNDPPAKPGAFELLGPLEAAAGSLTRPDRSGHLNGGRLESQVQLIQSFVLALLPLDVGADHCLIAPSR